MAKKVYLDVLEQRGRRALSRLPWFGRLELKAEDHRPQVYAEMLKLASEELPGDMVRSREFLSARGAVGAWASAQDLLDRASALYWDPNVRALVGNDENAMRHYWQNPSEAFAALTRHSIAVPKAYHEGPLADLLACAAEYETFHETHSSDPELGQDVTRVASAATVREHRRDELPVALPSVARRQDGQTPGPKPDRAARPARSPTSYEGLIARGKLTPAEWGRLWELAAIRHPDDEPVDNPSFGDEAKWPDGVASRGKPAAGSYDELIAKPHLTPAEYQWLLDWNAAELAEEEGLLPETYFEKE